MVLPSNVNSVLLLKSHPLARFSNWLVLACWFTLSASSSCFAAENTAAAQFRERVQPILETYCYGCHGYGASEGNRTLDEFASDEALVGNIELWWAVLKNVRAGIMPPAGEERPNDEERRQAFRLDQVRRLRHRPGQIPIRAA